MLDLLAIPLYRGKLPQNKSKANDGNSSTFPSFGIKYRKNLTADTVSFKGIAPLSQNGIYQLIEENADRGQIGLRLNSKAVNNIADKVTFKNVVFLEDLLTLNNKKLKEKEIVELLEYINKEDTDKEKFKEKLERFKNLKSILEQSDEGYTKSLITEHLDKIPSRGIADILKSDILLNNPEDGEFNSLQTAYNYAAKYFSNIDLNSQYKATEVMEVFPKILVLGQVYDESTLNEFFYNRKQYIDTMYMPRIRELDNADLKTLRKVQRHAVTDKENMGGDYVTYPISLDDKIWALNFLWANKKIKKQGGKGLNFDDYIRYVDDESFDQNFMVDFQKMKVDLMDSTLKHIGIPEDFVDHYTEEWKKAYEEDPTLKNTRKDFWDINYAHLMNAPKGSLLRRIIVADTLGKFNDLLYKNGDIADINRENARIFYDNGINYSRWINPKTTKPITLEFVDNTGTKTKKLTVKNWNRSAKESLFDGNYTTCCTGIDKNQGASFPHFLTNTCTTTLEVRNEKNKVVAMSRLLFAKIYGKVSLVVENIEVTNKISKHYLYDDETKYKFREMIFDYAREFAKELNMNDEEIPVYFSSMYYKVKGINKGYTSKIYEDDQLSFNEEDRVRLIGKFPDELYVNSYGGRLKNFYICDDSECLRLHLNDITKKAPFEGNKSPRSISNSDYNYADTANFGS